LDTALTECVKFCAVPQVDLAMISSTWELRVLFNHFLLANQMSDAAMAYAFYNSCRSMHDRIAALWQSLRGTQKGNRYTLQKLVVAPELRTVLAASLACDSSTVFSSNVIADAISNARGFMQTHQQGQLVDLDRLSSVFSGAFDEAFVFLSQLIQHFKEHLLVLQRHVISGQPIHLNFDRIYHPSNRR